MDVSYLWHFLLPGYLFSILIETPVLLVGLSRYHSVGRRLFAGAWLTACSYPIVVLVLPIVMGNLPRGTYLWVAETFAPACECALFAAAFHRRSSEPRAARGWDYFVILLANLASFSAGECMRMKGWKLPG